MNQGLIPEVTAIIHATRDLLRDMNINIDVLTRPPVLGDQDREGTVKDPDHLPLDDILLRYPGLHQADKLGSKNDRDSSRPQSHTSPIIKREKICSPPGLKGEEE